MADAMAGPAPGHFHHLAKLFRLFGFRLISSNDYRSGLRRRCGLPGEKRSEQ
jgi:hypothetical protein